jgi:hypothetical protein
MIIRFMFHILPFCFGEFFSYLERRRFFMGTDTILAHLLHLEPGAHLQMFDLYKVVLVSLQIGSRDLSITQSIHKVTTMILCPF